MRLSKGTAAAGVLAAAALACPGAAPAAQLFPSVPPPAGAHTELVSTAKVGVDTTRYSYRYGPLVAAPGQNLILFGPVTIEHPQGEGYISRFKANLVGEDGVPPPVEQVHMHHALLINLSKRDATAPTLPDRFFAFAEEKTIAQPPAPYGYPVEPSDVWAINYMLHNETPQTRAVWVTYDLDFTPKATPTGLTMKPAFPVWVDVQNPKAYPVFDVLKGAGHNGLYTYPDDQPDAYGNGPKRNEWTAPADFTLISGAGHLHPGGLHVDLFDHRGGATAHLFRSNANYFDPNGPVSWDMAMDFTPPDWRAHIKKGDTLSVNVTYDTSRASWFDSMGMVLMYGTYDGAGPDPFAQRVDEAGAPTHGHLPEDSNHGGLPTALPDATKEPATQAPQNGVAIDDFVYMPGDLSSSGSLGNPPVVNRGQSLTFTNFDAAGSVFHSVSACRQPCNGSTGISYPLSDGEIQFDSAQLGYGPQNLTASAQRDTWSTPPNLPPGTYTFYCRVHPFMRGAFRVAGTPAASTAKAQAAGPPTIAIVSKSLRMDRRGRVPVRLRCNGRGGTCKGSLHIASVHGPKVVALGKARFTVRAGRVRSVRIRLARSKRRLVIRRRRVPVLARARPSGGGATSSATLALRAPKTR